MRNSTAIFYLLFLLVVLLPGCSKDTGTSEITFPEERPSSTTMAPSRAISVASNANFGPRDSATLLDFDDMLLLFWGFYRNNSNYQDVWLSIDGGLYWALAGGNPYPLNNELTDVQYYETDDFPRVYSAIIESQGFLWAVSDTVWKSKDAKSWQKVSDSGPVPKTLTGIGVAGHPHIFQIHNYFVFISTLLGTVWKSDNLMEWQQWASISDFTPRCGSVSFKVKDTIYIAGGSRAGASGCHYDSPANDAWYSLDGKSWKIVKPASGTSMNFPWMPRMWPCVVVDEENVTWLVGGYNPDSNTNLKDVWFSKDMINWDLLTEPATGEEPGALTFRHAPACLYQKDSRSILIAGGKGGANPDNDSASTMNDVLVFKLPAINSTH